MLSGRNGKDKAIFVIVEIDLPTLSVSYPTRLLKNRLNLNDLLEIVSSIDVDPDKVLFSAAVIYDFETKVIVNFEYFTFRLTLWNLIHSLS